VYVLGEVAKPGAYPLRGRMTILQALALAGGPTEFAATSRIVLLRGPEPKRYQIDFTRLVKDAHDFALQSGDTVYVP
jgi:polysaccharide export outer membrane protein